MSAPACRFDAPRGYRQRSVAELDADLVAACRTLGQLANEWAATGHIPQCDLPHVDAIAHGLHSILVALRAGGSDAA